MLHQGRLSIGHLAIYTALLVSLPELLELSLHLVPSLRHSRLIHVCPHGGSLVR